MSDDRELAGLVGRAYNVRGDLLQLQACVQTIVDWYEQRWVRWLDVLEARRAERRLAFLAELDELEREITALLAQRQAA